MGSPHAKPLPGRLRRTACCAALLAASTGALPASAAPLVAFASQGAGLWAAEPVTLVWYDVQEQLPEGFATMAHEVRSIFAEIGVEVGWRAAAPGESYGGGATREIAVIALAEDPSLARRSTPVLGLVIREPQPTRAFWAFVGNLRRALGLEKRPGERLGPRECERLARALGRVVAHEVVHALAPEHPHGVGLMKHALSRALLTGPRRPLGDACARSVLQALRQPSLPFRAAGPAELLLAIP